MVLCGINFRIENLIEMKPVFLKTSFVLLFFAVVIYACNNNSNTIITTQSTFDTSRLWFGSSKYNIPEHDSMVRYGYQLISNTSYFLGPNGTVAHLTNGMNCQNCHLNGGTVPWGNNYGAVASTYPQFRARSGGLETVVKRISDCMERSLNGTAIDSTSIEMKAIIAYMNWLGEGVP